jgi:hypothetical protein
MKLKPEKIDEKFDELISECKSIEQYMEVNKTKEISPIDYYRVLSSTIALLTHLGASVYIQLLNDYQKNSKIYPGILRGILESAKRETKFGLIQNIRFIISADALSDMLGQAEYLLDNDFKDPACVIIGGVLEQALKTVIENKYPSLSTNNYIGLGKLNEDLYKALEYDKVTFKFIDSYSSIRNSAAHGHYNDYNLSQVRDFLNFTKRLISDKFNV